MARSRNDLPRMQKQSPTRAPLERPVAVMPAPPKKLPGASQEALKTAPTKPSRKPQAMMRQYDLIERGRRYNPHTNEAPLNRAYAYAMKAPGGQRRA